MTTNDAIRQRILKLVNQGINQKVVASKIGVSATWMSRWLHPKNQQDKKLVIDVDQVDRFFAYVKDLGAFLQETQRAAFSDTSTTAEQTFSESATGTADPAPHRDTHHREGDR